MAGAPEEAIQSAALDEADKKLTWIIRTYKLDDPVDFINPINWKEEQKKFFDFLNQGIAYDPQFKYKPLFFAEEDVMRQTQQIMRDLRGLKIDYSKGIGKIFEKKRYDLMTKLKLIRIIGTPKVTKYSIWLYGKPSSSLVKEAIKICLSYKAGVQEKKTYNAKKAKKEAEQALKQNGIEGWTVEINSTIAGNAFVSPKDKKLMFREGVLFSESDIKRLIVHEIKTHIERAMAGKKAKYRIFEFGTSGFLPTEEIKYPCTLPVQPPAPPVNVCSI